MAMRSMWMDMALMVALALLEFCLGVALGTILARRYYEAAEEAPMVAVEVAAPAAYDSCPDWGRHGY